MERAGRRSYRGVAGGRGALASLRRARATPRALAGYLHDGGELARRWGVESGYGSPAARWVYGIRCFPRLRYRGEMTGGVGHSRQRWGLDKGAGSEALTSDGRRGGQSSGGVAVPSFSRCSRARRRVRVVGGCCSRGESRGKRRMEELTEVVRSMETKKRRSGQRRRARWRSGRIAFPSSSGTEIRPASTDTRGLRSGGSVAVRWLAAEQLLLACVASVRAADKRCWTLTSGPSAILNF
jgi:hypothetical protein